MIGLCSTSLFQASCNFRPGLGSGQEVARVIELARQRTLDQTPSMDAVSREMIRTNQPKFASYFMAGDYAQYDISWPVTSNRVVHLYGEGRLRTLENAAVTIRKY